ncbi:MAG: polysaccharide biosynthesis/export family protein [Pirellulales bacterium]
MTLRPQRSLLVLVGILLAMCAGCQSVATPPESVVTGTLPPNDVPRELCKVALPTYRIEPPDILLIDAIKVVPKAPYRIEPLDTLLIAVVGTLPDLPIAGNYLVEPGGTVNLGASYGMVRIAGMSIEEATAAIDKHLKQIVQNPEVTVNLVQSSGEQQIAGEHLVGPDGTVNLGNYDSVYVAGMTVREAKERIQEHLAQFLESPQVAVDVYAYNSKVYYIITQGAGLGDGVARFPITGNETVLDALAQINGTTHVSSKRIWIARPAPDGSGCDQRLPVNWTAITEGAATATNYQILPGDRIFVAEDKMVAFDTTIGKIISPFERIFGFASLGGQTFKTFKFIGSNRGTNNF